MTTPPTDRGSAAERAEEVELDILDHLDECVIRTDISALILSWNKGAERLYGWSRQEAVGKRLWELVGDDGREADDGPPKELMDNGHLTRDMVRRTKDGREITVEARWSLRRDASGNPIEVIGTARDISALKKAEHALRISDDRYRSLFQAMAASFWELDFLPVGGMLRQLRINGVKDFAAYFRDHPEFIRDMMTATRVVDVNGQTVSLFGADREELLQSNVEPFWPEESGMVYAEAVIAAVTGRLVYSRETVLRSLDGTRFNALFTACFPPESVSNGKLLIGVVDISERVKATRELEQSETRYRHVVQHLPIALMQLDMSQLQLRLNEISATGANLPAWVDAHPEFVSEILDLVRVSEANEQAVAMFDADAPADLVRPIAYAWKTRPETIYRSIQARMRGDASYSEETKVDTLRGDTKDILYTIAFSPALLERGMNIVGFLDISDRVKAQNALAQLEADLAHSGRVAMLGELTASIAHEVNQPLAAITTNAEAGLRWLRRPDPDMDELRELTSCIVADARRAGEVIDRVRSLAARRSPERRPVDTETLMREVVSFLAHEARRNNVTIDTHIAAGLPQVLGDRTQLQQVLVNLVINAIQSLSQATGRARRITIAGSEIDDGRIQFSVSDNGVGLGPNAQSQAFDPFFTTKERGMGMGLTICRSIVEAHGGRIELSGGAGGIGAIAGFTLPRA